MALLRVRIAVAICSFLCMAITGSYVWGESPQDLEVRYRAILKTHHETVAKLKGVATANGRFENGGTQGARGEVTLYMAFDYSKGLLRFDRSEPVAGSETRTTGGRFVRTPEWMLLKQQNTDIASVETPTQTTPKWARVIDFRTLCLAHYGDLGIGTSVSDVYANYDKQIPVAIEDEGSLVKVTWYLNLARRCVWFDKEKGYWPVRFTLEEGNSVDANGKVLMLKGKEEFLVELAEKGGQFVPKAVTFRFGELKQTETLKFDWKSVGQEVDGVVFSLEGMPKKEILFVVDRTTQKKQDRPFSEYHELPAFQKK